MCLQIRSRINSIPRNSARGAAIGVIPFAILNAKV
jgi:hypothetical protein